MIDENSTSIVFENTDQLNKNNVEPGILANNQLIRTTSSAFRPALTKGQGNFLIAAFINCCIVGTAGDAAGSFFKVPTSQQPRPFFFSFNFFLLIAPGYAIECSPGQA